MNNLRPVNRLGLTADKDQLMSRVAYSLREGDKASAIEAWSRLIKSLTTSGSGVSENHLNELIWLAISRAGLEPDIPEAAKREDLASSKVELEAYIKSLEERLNTVGDDAQLANVDLQNQLQKQQQTLQMMSNISKLLHDTAMAVIRNIGG